jgi:hypothetical protein
VFYDGAGGGEADDSLWEWGEYRYDCEYEWDDCESGSFFPLFLLSISSPFSSFLPSRNQTHRKG